MIEGIGGLGVVPNTKKLNKKQQARALALLAAATALKVNVPSKLFWQEVVFFEQYIRTGEIPHA